MSQSRKEMQPSAQPDRKSGRAVFDEGRTVWEWQTATGVFERHVSEEQMARLEHAGLRLVDHTSPDAGRAIYGADQTGSHTAYATRKQVFLARPTAGGRAAGAAPKGALRQFLRRLVPSA
ncbi:hypothetical protein [Steroidobacter sp.]|uniref:hypothetical protein n=1 Tax=Steroidobacter sp. TaxID=1978227 RepID=UPI001A5A06E5|nr:hypothetical protein [Steroidobacter sp.]MBL8268218.1 hypothetical protein [Steroidobacter sp.]